LWRERGRVLVELAVFGFLVLVLAVASMRS
jgi:hypothetical protein